MKIAVIGRTQMLYATAIALDDTGHDIKAIITAPAAPEYTKKEDDFEALAEKLHCPYFLSNSLDNKEMAKICEGLDLGVSLNWVSIVQQEHINWFKSGILNAHVGDLPKYRGNACPNWAILQGEKEICLSIHFMEGGILDCGRIIHQERMELGENTTIGEIYTWIEEVIPSSFLKACRVLEENPSYVLKYADPDDEMGFRCFPRLPQDGFIDWNLPVRKIHRLVRASGPPFVGAYTYHLFENKLRKLLILKSRIIIDQTKDLAVPGQVLKNDKESGESWIRCQDGVLGLVLCRYEGEVEEFQPGKRWRSIRMRLGVSAADVVFDLIKEKADEWV